MLRPGMVFYVGEYNQESHTEPTQLYQVTQCNSATTNVGFKDPNLGPRTIDHQSIDDYWESVSCALQIKTFDPTGKKEAVEVFRLDKVMSSPHGPFGQ